VSFDENLLPQSRKCAESILVLKKINFPFFNRYSIPDRKVRASIHISEKYKCVYVVTPKVACSTVLRTMQIFEVDGDDSRLAKSPHDHKNSPMKRLPIFSLSDGPLEDDGYYKFSFVRNPFTRVASAFLNKFNVEHPKRPTYMRKLGLARDAELTFLEFLHKLSEIDPRTHNKHWMPLTLVM
jgi:hypothetical protein